MLHDPGFRAARLNDAIDRVVAIARANADTVDREGRFPVEAVTALREEALLGMMVPVDLGGLGAPLAVATGMAQRLGGACASTAMIFAMHQIQVACVLEHALKQAWHRALAGRIATDQLLLASITSEVGTGGDMRSSVCAAEIADGRVDLTKQAPTVSYGAYADVFLVTARGNANAARSDQVLVSILRDGSTMASTGGWDSLGMRGTCSGGFTFVGTGVADQVMPADFADIAADTMTPVSHLIWAGVWTGIAADAVTRARTFLRAQARRTPGAVPPGAPRLMRATGLLESMHGRIAALLASYDACHALGSARDVVSEEEAGWPAGLVRATTLNMLKHDISEMCHSAVLEALLICGMAGYKNGTEYSVGRNLRDVLSAQLMINNDRIATNTGVMLVGQRSALGKL